MLHEIRVSGTVLTLVTLTLVLTHVHKPKIVVVETVLSSDFRINRGPPVVSRSNLMDIDLNFLLLSRE